jgi:hypothetical protein
MAYLLSTANGNWSSSSTWSLCDGTNFIDSRAVSTTIPTVATANTSFSWSSGAPTLQGIAVQLSIRNTAVSGTLTAELYNVTGATSVRSVTVNVSDISTTYGTTGSMWVFFKFASNVTLATGTNYVIRLSTSAGSVVACYASATTNWSYQLVTTTNQALLANDSVIITGKHTGAGAVTGSIVTMDNTSATQYGNIFISNQGILTFGTAASTNYALANNGVAGTVFYVSYGGSLYIGGYNPGSGPVWFPTSSTATITLNCASALSTPMFIYGTIMTATPTYNYSMVSLNYFVNKLNADVNAGATSSTLTDGTTGWKNGDQIVIPSTTRTAAQVEVITLNADQSSTNITHNAYVNAHGGNTGTLVQADIFNLTRNIIIKSGSTTFRSNIQVQANAQVWFYSVRFQDLGTGVAATTYGICVPTLSLANSAVFYMYYSVMLNTVANSATLSGTGLYTQLDNNTGVGSNVFYNLGWTAVSLPCLIYRLNDTNKFVGNYSSTYICSSTYCGSSTVFASNTATNGAYSGGFAIGSSYNYYYSNSGYGIYFVGNALSQNMYGFFIWRNNTGGMVINNAATTNQRTFVWDFTACYIFGNAGGGIVMGAALYTRVWFNACSIYGGTTLVQQYAFNVNSQYIENLTFQSCNFGIDTGAQSSPHTTANLLGINRNTSVQFNSCSFNGTEIVTPTPAALGSSTYGLSFISTNHNNTGINKQWLLNGTLSGDSTIYKTSSPSLRMTPSSTVYRLCSSTIKVPLDGSSSTLNISFSVKKSSINLLTYTEDITNAAWLSDAPAVTKTANVINSPLGTLTADKISEASTALGSWNIYQSIAASVVVPGTLYVYSVYLKAAERQYARISLGTASVVNGGDVFVDLSTGTIFTQNGYGTATLQITDIINAGNGWWRCVLGVSFAASAIIYPSVQIRPDNSGSTATYNGVVGRGLYIWGSMMYTESTGNYVTGSPYPYEAVLTTPTNTPYNGTQPQYKLAAGPPTQAAIDYGSNISTPSTYTTSGWETFTFTVSGVQSGVLEFYFDCDGNQGWINVDDISVTPSADSRGTQYYAPNGMYLEADWRKPGGSYGFVN